MKNKLSSTELGTITIILLNLLGQNWSNVTILDYIVFASSAVVLILLGMKLFKKE